MLQVRFRNGWSFCPHTFSLFVKNYFHCHDRPKATWNKSEEHNVSISSGADGLLLLQQLLEDLGWDSYHLLLSVFRQYLVWRLLGNISTQHWKQGPWLVFMFAGNEHPNFFIHLLYRIKKRFMINGYLLMSHKKSLDLYAQVPTA